MIPPSRRDFQPKRSHPFWIQLPDIRPTKVIFVKDINPTGPLAQHILSYCSKAFSSNYRYAFRTQEWFNLATDDVLRLRRTPPLVSWFTGW
jgi:hypothetical protein